MAKVISRLGKVQSDRTCFHRFMQLQNRRVLEDLVAQPA
jgi:hypothetical protein